MTITNCLKDERRDFKLTYSETQIPGNGRGHEGGNIVPLHLYLLNQRLERGAHMSWWVVEQIKFELPPGQIYGRCIKSL
jgi:hypothetical protein